eukprot:gene14925-20075_t
MHIAICFWGLLRSLSFTIDSIKTFCLDPIINEGHTFEIFIHTYSFSGTYQNTRNKEQEMTLNFSEWKMLNPDYVYVEDQDLFDHSFNYTIYQTHGDAWKNNYTSFKNHIRALHSLNHLGNLIKQVMIERGGYQQVLNVNTNVRRRMKIKNNNKGHVNSSVWNGTVYHTKNNLNSSSNIDRNSTQHSQLRKINKRMKNNSDKMIKNSESVTGISRNRPLFDSVIFLRPDVTYINPLPVFLLEKYQNNTLFLPNFHRSCKGNEYNDRMAMGNVNSSIIYATRLENIYTYSLQHMIHSEKYTYYHLKHNNINVLEIPFRFRRTRANGDIHVRDVQLITPEQQHKITIQNKDPKPTPWYLRYFYSLNYNDYNNMYCKPNKFVSFDEIIKYDNENNNNSNNRTKKIIAHEIHQTVVRGMLANSNSDENSSKIENTRGKRYKRGRKSQNNNNNNYN